ncbi:MAG: PAS domain-containing sensor histidine kinase [Thermoflexibacter sp.]|nr:PAS domain-containing sensor histidine kinase [Thermoflexibacter sp.]
MSVTLKSKNSTLRNAQAQNTLHIVPPSAGNLAVIKTEVVEIFNHIKDVVFQTDENLNYIYLNDAWVALTGYHINETKQNLFFQFVHTTDLAKFAEVLDMAIVQKESIDTELKLLHKNGEAIIVQLFLKPLFNIHGSLVGIVGTMKDITERKRNEEKLQLMYQALQKSDKEAQRLNLELETFMYKASHDLLGPLASIHGLLVLAKAQQNQPETSKYLGLITQSANQLMITLENLLEITKIKQGKPQSSEVNFREIIDEIITFLSSNSDFTKINFEYIIDVEGIFYSDKNLIFSILLRLIENAFAYRRSNIVPFIYVSIIGNAQLITIKIEDNGQGMVGEVQEKIFDMFFKGSELNHGSGLGLYIVKNVLDKLNGTIQVESQERKGSTFTVVIPAMQ